MNISDITDKILNGKPIAEEIARAIYEDNLREAESSTGLFVALQYSVDDIAEEQKHDPEWAPSNVAAIGRDLERHRTMAAYAEEALRRLQVAKC